MRTLFWNKSTGKIMRNAGVIYCCCGPAPCCLYPYPGSDRSAYTADDLPDEVNLELASPDWDPFSGTYTLNHTSGSYEYTYGDSTINLRITVLDPDSWLFEIATVANPEAWNLVMEVPCLITTLPSDTTTTQRSYDSFNDTYTFNFTDGSDRSMHSGDITRTSICCWTGTIDGLDCSICYISDTPHPAWAWTIDGDGGEKATGETQSSPVGTYADSARFSALSVA